ncbi:MAG: hypothetical protein NUV78_01640, partial [Candidatus Zambryskibacteria bacterium]|nr:hypothetical protein [Candidatus Zambryskibacteria bacterium]
MAVDPHDFLDRILVENEVAKEISESTGLTPWVGEVFPELKDQYVIALKAEGLCAPTTLYWMVSGPFWQKVEDAVQVMRSLGIDPA